MELKHKKKSVKCRNMYTTLMSFFLNSGSPNSTNSGIATINGAFT